MNEQRFIRNFAIIAHIDHGKSTLADRLLEHTATVSKREMREQFLDSMDLERERGITIKLKAVRMNYPFNNNKYQLNMIDTPGHVDFSYEVSRSLAACEGAVLVVDATQGVQAQTVANVYKALDQKLTIIPFVNKIDLKEAMVLETVSEIERTFGFKKEDIILGSAKDGTGVDHLLSAIIEKVPPPSGDTNAPLRSLIFDSFFDEHKGVVAIVKITDGSLVLSDYKDSRSNLKFLATNCHAQPLGMGFVNSSLKECGRLETGEVGLIFTGLKDIKKVRVGDTITKIQIPAVKDQKEAEPLPGYQEPKSVVFLGLYPVSGTDFLALRQALDKLSLSDASLNYEAESSGALGMGFRCGFLGLLHADIVQERLEREYGLNLISTTPSVSYQVILTNGEVVRLKRASDLPDLSKVDKILEPFVKLFLFSPDAYTGSILKLMETCRADFKNMEYLGQVVKFTFEVPLSEIITDFYDRLKSVSSGYASLDYELTDFREEKLVRLDILVSEERIDPLALIVPREKAVEIGKKLLLRLKDTIDKHQFVVVLQAAIGGKIVAREEIPAMRKNVLAKMSGGHRERKDKLLEKQREGKRRMKKMGRVEIPQEAFRAVLESS